MSEEKNFTIYDVITKKKEISRKVDTKLIMKAFNYANEKHKYQKRGSGEPYIIHPINVAYILAEIGLDDSTICAALLHDVVEDTDTTHEEIVENFGIEIADMVQGVTKLGNIQFATIEETQVENYTDITVKDVDRGYNKAALLGLLLPIIMVVILRLMLSNSRLPKCLLIIL